jgi:hypothetical protein
MSNISVSVHTGEDSEGHRTWSIVESESFLRDYNANFAYGLWFATGSQFTFHAVIAAAHVLATIISKGSARVDIPDEMKMGVMQATICHVIAHTNARTTPGTEESIALIDEIPESYNVDKKFLKDFFHHTGKWSTPAGRICVHYARDAIILFPAFLQHPRTHMKEEQVWIECKHRMEMAAAFMHSQPGRDLYNFVLPHWLSAKAATAAPAKLIGSMLSQAIIKQQEIIERAKSAIKEIASHCDHPSESCSEECTSDTGNWCRDDDTYYRKVTCKVCGSQFHFSKNTGRNQPEVLDSTVQVTLPIK